jgi:DNA (cytosine-5)-methyltransferase 1
MRYGSVCSGIEAATMAWHPLGWTPAFFSEIEKFPSAVLAHHYGSNLPGEEPAINGVPNLGDMTKFQEWPDHAIDLLVGGTPCQSFSVAGLRAGLADPRGNLMLTYLAIAARYRPRWLVWENVPGVLSSNGGRDFGTLLRGLGELGYGFAYRVLDAQFCRAHGYEWAVPQRRRRVFVVGYLGDWRRAAAVLFDGTSLRGDSPPRREAGQRVAPTISSRPTGGGGLGTDFDLDGGLIANSGDVGYCLTASAQQSLDAETETLIATAPPAVSTREVAGALTSNYGKQPDSSDTALGPNLVAISEPIVLMERGRGDGPNLETRQDGTANAILTPNGGRGGLGVGAVAYGIQAGATRENPSSGPDGVGVQSDIAYTVEARAEVQAVAFAENSRGELRLQGGDGAVSPQLTTGGGKPGQGQPCVAEAWAVRRLTPRECERLQGFPDDFTAIPYRGKPAADGPRYKSLGNSMAVNVMRVLGERIAMVEAMSGEIAA